MLLSGFILMFWRYIRMIHITLLPLTILSLRRRELSWRVCYEVFQACHHKIFMVCPFH